MMRYAVAHEHNKTLFAGALLNCAGAHLFSSQDLDETRSLVGSVMTSHGLQVSGRARDLEARMHHMRFGAVAISRLKYGADVRIAPQPLKDFYLVQMPVSGHATVRCGNQQIISTPQVASVLGIADAATMDWSADNDQLMVRIDKALVDQTIQACLGKELGTTLNFRLDFAWQESAIWRCMIQYLSECATSAFDPAQHRLVAASIDQMVASTLISCHASTFSNCRAGSSMAVLPRHIRKAEEFLRCHAHESITVEQVALVAGVSLRGLYTGFKEHYGTSPMQYLKKLRLEGARDTLRNLQQADTVTSVAMQWGFLHMGRFSADYKNLFGEAPSQTAKNH